MPHDVAEPTSAAARA